MTLIDSAKVIEAAEQARSRERAEADSPITQYINSIPAGRARDYAGHMASYLLGNTYAPPSWVRSGISIEEKTAIEDRLQSLFSAIQTGLTAPKTPFQFQREYLAAMTNEQEHLYACHALLSLKARTSLPLRPHGVPFSRSQQILSDLRELVRQPTPGGSVLKHSPDRFADNLLVFMPSTEPATYVPVINLRDAPDVVNGYRRGMMPGEEAVYAVYVLTPDLPENASPGPLGALNGQSEGDAYVGKTAEELPS